MKRGIRKIFLAIGLLAAFPMIASAEQGEVVNCFDYYKFQSVNMNVGPDKSVYMPGESVSFSGELTNENNYPVVDGYVFIRVSKSNSSYETDWHDAIDEFVALEKVTLDAGAEKRIDFEWNVPNVSSGDYRADYFFSVGKKYNLGGLPFTNEVTIGSSEFQIIADGEEAISLVRSETKVNGQKYAHIGNWPKIKAGEKAEITQPLKNSFSAPKQVNISYDLYWWDSLDEKDKIASKSERLTVPANGTIDLSYLIPEMKDSVYMLKITAQSGSQKSIVNIRLTSDQDHPRLNYPGLTKFPLQKDASFDLFSCFHNTSPTKTSGSVNIILEDSEGKNVGQLEYNGAIAGEMTAVKKSLTAQQTYFWLKLTATLQDKDGKTLETYETVYDCAKLESDECKTALATQKSKKDATKKTRTLAIGLIAALTILSLVIIMIKKKNQGIALIFFCLLAYGILVNTNTSEAAVSYSYPKQIKKTYFSAIMGFTGGSGVFATGESGDEFPRSQFPNLYCDCSSIESVCYKSCGYIQENDGGAYFNSFCKNGFCSVPPADQYVGVDKAFGNEENEDGVCDVTAAWKLNAQQMTAIYKMGISDATKPLGVNEQGVILIDPKSTSLTFVSAPDKPTYNATGDTWDTPNGNWCEDRLNCGTWVTETTDGNNLYSKLSVKNPVGLIRLTSSNNAVIGCNGVAGNLNCVVKGPGAATITATIPEIPSRIYAQVTEDGDKCIAFKAFKLGTAALNWKVRINDDNQKESVQIKLVDKDTGTAINYNSPSSPAIAYRIEGKEFTTGAVNGKSPLITADVVAKSTTGSFRITPPAIASYTHLKTRFNCNGVITENMGTLKDGISCTGIVYYSAVPSNPPTATITAPLNGQEFTLATTTASMPQSSIFAKLWGFLKAKLALAAPQSVATVTFKGYGTDPDDGDVIVAHRWYDRAACYDADGNYIPGCVGDIIHEESGTGVGSHSTFTKNYTEPGNYHIYYQVESQHADESGHRIGGTQYSTTETDPSDFDHVRFKITNPESPAIPEVNLKINNSLGPVTVNKGDPLNLKWETKNVVNCTASGAGWTGGKSSEPPSQTETISATASSNYQLTCWNPSETERAYSNSVRVNVCQFRCVPANCDDACEGKCGVPPIIRKCENSCTGETSETECGGSCSACSCPTCPTSGGNWKEVAP